ncbi:hypothetical protein [Luteimonas sp. YGD11-2]|uniref:hypothetical protein n=1 Tax=Luteimonas sp. YGD11-2 TaxID=2508168 RepID=UPI0013E91298|nr:hypothetical protein [Luteimonas sp. YGD11-2]
MLRHPACLLLTIACCLMPALARGFEVPDVTYPAIAERAATTEAFAPPGWRLEHLARGRLDADDREDALLVLRMDDPANVIDNSGFGPDRFDTNPRMLVAVLAQPDGSWRRVMHNHTLVPRPESPVMDDYLDDDPAHAVTIHPNRTWSVALRSWASAGTWSMRQVSHTFRLEGDCMRLVGYDDMHLHRASGETMTTSVNHLTGRAWTRPGSIEDDAPGPQRHTRLAANPRLCIDEVGDGLSYLPELLDQ